MTLKKPICVCPHKFVRAFATQDANSFASPPLSLFPPLLLFVAFLPLLAPHRPSDPTTVLPVSPPSPPPFHAPLRYYMVPHLRSPRPGRTRRINSTPLGQATNQPHAVCTYIRHQNNPHHQHKTRCGVCVTHVKTQIPRKYFWAS